MTAADRPSVTDQALAEAWAEGHRTGWEHCQDGSYGNDHWDDPTPNPYAAAGRAETTTETPPAEAGATADDAIEDAPGERGGSSVPPRSPAGRAETTIGWGGPRPKGILDDPAETTTATTEDAARVINEVLGGGMDNHARIAAHRLADAGLLATARTRPTREQIIDALVMSPLSDTAGTDMRPFEQTADAVLELLADQPTEAEAGARALEQAAEWLRSDMDEPWGDRAANRLDVRAARIRAGGA